MGNRKILKYFFSALFLLSGIIAYPQQKWQGLSVGLDLSRIALPFIDTTRLGWQAQADYELMPDMFVSFEMGSETTNLNKANYHYRSNGGYTRIGVDYNFMKHIDEGTDDKITIGLRYAFTTFYHEADQIRVRDPYWGDFTGGSIERNWMSANWAEVALGMRAHLFNNFYLGWSARIKMMIWPGNDKTMYPYNIPGYGNAGGKNSIGVNYSLYYMIPIKKKKTTTEKGK